MRPCWFACSKTRSFASSSDFTKTVTSADSWSRCSSVSSTTTVKSCTAHNLLRHIRSKNLWKLWSSVECRQAARIASKSVKSSKITCDTSWTHFWLLKMTSRQNTWSCFLTLWVKLPKHRTLNSCILSDLSWSKSSITKRSSSLKTTSNAFSEAESSTSRACCTTCRVAFFATKLSRSCLKYSMSPKQFNSRLSRKFFARWNPKSCRAASLKLLWTSRAIRDCCFCSTCIYPEGNQMSRNKRKNYRLFFKKN